MSHARGLVLVSHLAACGRQDEVARAPARPAAAPSPAAAAGSAAVPAGWVVETPSSSMRVAQFRLPGAGGSGDAELAVFSFPGGGGTAAANLERWIGQFEQPGGGPSAAVAEQSREELDGVTLHRLELGGTYVAETTPGSGVRLEEPGWRLIGAVVEGPGGTRFVKCVGPADTVARWRESVDAYIRTVRP
jgi:hypothetical protein